MIVLCFCPSGSRIATTVPGPYRGGGLGVEPRRSHLFALEAVISYSSLFFSRVLSLPFWLVFLSSFVVLSHSVCSTPLCNRLVFFFHVHPGSPPPPWPTSLWTFFSFPHDDGRERPSKTTCGTATSSYMNIIMARAYCHKIIKLSAVIQSLAPEKETVCNVHGVREKFLEVGGEYAHKVNGRIELPERGPIMRRERSWQIRWMECRGKKTKRRTLLSTKKNAKESSIAEVARKVLDGRLRLHKHFAVTLTLEQEKKKRAQDTKEKPE